MGNPWENPWKTMETQWELVGNDGKIWKKDGETMRKWKAFVREFFGKDRKSNGQSGKRMDNMANRGKE